MSLQNAPVRTSSPPTQRHGDGRLPLPAMPKERYLKPRGKIRNLLRRMAIWGTTPFVFAGFWASGIEAVPAALFSLGAVALVYGYRRFSKVRRFNEANSQLIVRLNSGDEKVTVALEEQAKQYRKDRSLHAITLYNLAFAEIINGHPERALSLFASMRKSTKQKRLQQIFPYHVATAHALLGDVAAAQEWLDEGDQRNQLEHLRVDVLARGLIFCRRHDFSRAAKYLDDEWSRTDGMYTGKLRHAVAIIRAFALAESGVSPDDEIFAALIASTRLSKKEFGFLGVHWNEMQSFLAEHRLL